MVLKECLKNRTGNVMTKITSIDCSLQKNNTIKCILNDKTENEYAKIMIAGIDFDGRKLSYTNKQGVLCKESILSEEEQLTESNRILECNISSKRSIKLDRGGGHIKIDTIEGIPIQGRGKYANLRKSLENLSFKKELKVSEISKSQILSIRVMIADKYKGVYGTKVVGDGLFIWRIKNR